MSWPSFLIGGIAGLALGLLLAPRPGTETRERLIEQAGDAFTGHGARDMSGGLRETAEEVREILLEAVAEGREILREAIQEGRQASARTQEEMHRRYEEQTGKDA